MTADLVKLLDRGYQIIWREHDVERALRNLDPRFEWVVPGHPEGAVRRGPDATIAFFYDWIDSWEDLSVDWELHPAGPNRVLAVLTMRGRGRASGAPAEMRAGQLWFFREDGAAKRMILYDDLDEARRAAGL